MRHLYLDSHFQPDMYKSNSCPSSPNQLFPQFSKWKNPFLRLLRLKSLRLYKTSVFLLYFISNLSANPVTFSSKISPNSDPLSSPPPCFELSFYVSYYNSCQTGLPVSYTLTDFYEQPQCSSFAQNHPMDSHFTQSNSRSPYYCLQVPM